MYSIFRNAFKAKSLLLQDAIGNVNDGKDKMKDAEIDFNKEKFSQELSGQVLLTNVSQLAAM